MASALEVKQYLAHWFQLGRKVYIHNGNQALLPSRVFSSMDYSMEFEQCWDLILSARSGECYLEDTSQTIAELLTPQWELVDCARCSMLIPLQVAGIPSEHCPCINLPHWPNLDVPTPRLPVAVRSKLTNMQERLERLADDN
ncbi:hypothetical protein [Chamaesiphon minutus]|uniref:Uncharacterized protein n=1 Tax=Chamaesiphon minutus (strain ATCC 27169 / PCC 6605) TaxID=1173020 RepID=K9UNT6_CHAP6|nr:hypothetical protein [Chamaesiphon minutus]AFY95844.1 hypothetical protein Cha6605_4935 [Chamaesiphon minutus PCC 6605]